MFSEWSRTVQTLYILFSVCCFGVSDGLMKMCGEIIPESPVLQIGSNFTASCILYNKCVEKENIHANQIIWKIRDVPVPKEQYIVINDTVSNVTFNDTSTLASPLTCNVLMQGGIEQNIYGIQIQMGFPPDKPKNLSCIVFQIPKNDKLKEYNQTCTWDPGRETFLDTVYSLKSQWPDKFFPDCTPDRTNNSCTTDTVAFYVSLEVWVTAKNKLGEAESDHIVFDPIKHVKPLPPHNLSLNSGNFSTILKLSWENQFIMNTVDLKYEIRFKAVDSTDWMKVPPEDTINRRSAFTVQELKPNTKYVFQIRCALKGLHYWSDWSEKAFGFTAEGKPSKGPALWRKITTSVSTGNWILLLLWKLDPSEANGVIRTYEVSVMGKPPVSFPTSNYSLNTTQLLLNVQNGTYEVRVTARNSAGESPTSVLLIPAINSKAPVKNVTASPKDGKLWVEWEPPNDDVSKYIVEWYEHCDNVTCTSDWQQEPGTKRGTFLKGDIKPFKRYEITVHPLYINGQGQETSIQAYLQEGEPARGPIVRTVKVGKSKAVLEWKPLSVEEQNGFITKYVISYNTLTTNETGVSVGVEPFRTEYYLSSLSSDTLYTVQVTAFTKKGGKSGPVFTFTTKKFEEGEIETIVVPVCLAFLLVILLTVLFCFKKKEVIKKHIWPNVPDPSKSVIAQWSPQTPSKHFNSKEQIYPEGIFTNVSAVEIEADHEKSFSEQDMKPFDLVKKEKNASEGHSSGIGGSSCMSSPRQSVSDSDEGEPAQSTSSTVQYSTVVPSGYRDQIPSVQVFSRSESTQPLLDLEDKPEDQQALGRDDATPRLQYFKQNCNQDDTGLDGSHLERVKQIFPINEEDTSGIHNPPMCNSVLEISEHDTSFASAFHPGPEGPAVQSETITINSLTGDETPKCYLPQTVMQGGYMPQ
uniref:Interleukin-6 receptor subunit beta n=1 Tax=Salvator merianae TaxID=96440 RepID=A0A8D0E165_SALMN